MGSVIFVFCEIGFESFGKFAPCKHDASPTSFAFQPNICTQARHRPFVGAAGMLLAESQVVMQAQVSEHGGHGAKRKELEVNDNHYK